MTENYQEYSPFALSLLRDQLLPNLLGEETDEILYWAGKELARKQPMNEEGEITSFFNTFGFGNITLTEMKKNRRHYLLDGPLVAHRLTETHMASFSLEAGFLAEQIQRITGMFTEANYKADARKQYVQLTLQSDPKEDLPY